jgi:hypothetical protein
MERADRADHSNLDSSRERKCSGSATINEYGSAHKPAYLWPLGFIDRREYQIYGVATHTVFSRIYVVRILEFTCFDCDCNTSVLSRKFSSLVFTRLRSDGSCFVTD